MNINDIRTAIIALKDRAYLSSSGGVFCSEKQAKRWAPDDVIRPLVSLEDVLFILTEFEREKMVQYHVSCNSNEPQCRVHVYNIDRVKQLTDVMYSSFKGAPLRIFEGEKLVAEKPAGASEWVDL